MPASRGFRSRQSPRRRTEWFQGVGGTAITSVASSSAGFLGGGVVTTFGEETLVRTRGILDLTMIAVTSPGDGFFGAVGIGLATSAAVAAGIASVPTPITESGWDGWLWHSFVSVHGGITLIANESSHQRVEIDSKAMRKVQDDMTLFAAFEVVEIGSAVMSVFLDTRMLSKLP